MQKSVCLTYDYKVPRGAALLDLFDQTQDLIALLELNKWPIAVFIDPSLLGAAEASDTHFFKKMKSQLLHLLSLNVEVGLFINRDLALRLTDQPDPVLTAIKHLSQVLGPGQLSIACSRCEIYDESISRQLSETAITLGIDCDSSVKLGADPVGSSSHNPYFASPYDLRLNALPVEEKLVEFPYTYDFNFPVGSEGLEGEKRSNRPIARKVLRFVYRILSPWRRQINKALPARLSFFLGESDGEEKLDHNYYTVNWNELSRSQIADALRTGAPLQFISLRKATSEARRNLVKLRTERDNQISEANFQVGFEYDAIMGDERNSEQSFYLQELIPQDVETVLDLGCGTGYWSYRIKKLRPRSRVIGVDWGEDFINKSKIKYAQEGVSFERKNFSSLDFTENSFDLIYADNTLEHAFDLMGLLKSCWHILKPEKFIVAAFPSDAYSWEDFCRNHTWRTHPAEARLRFETAGFEIVHFEEVDVFSTLGGLPNPPSKNKMIYVKAKKSMTGIKRKDSITP